MRRRGRLQTAAGLGLHGHACWAYSSDEEYRRGVVDFLAAGRGLGQRLLHIGPGGVDRLRSDLGGLPDVEWLLASGALRVMPLEAVEEAAAGDPDLGRLSVFAVATSAALADGYRGLRVSAEVTPTVGDPALCEAQLRWEAVADRYMEKHPMSALCCYDRRVVPEEIVGDVACVHRAAHAPPGAAPFQLFAGREGLCLAGTVDASSAGRLRRLLPFATPPKGDLVLELDELESIEDPGVAVLAEHARALARQGRRVRTLGAPDGLRL